MQDHLQDHPLSSTAVEQPTSASTAAVPAKGSSSSPQPISMLRLIIWSHHLLAPSKRRDLSALCSSLSLWGLFKLGYPGYLCFEGRRCDVEEALKEVKTWQWAAIMVRSEENWEYKGAAGEEGALLECKLAIGNSHFEAAKRAKAAGEKVRTGSDEVEQMKEIVDRLRGAGLQESEVVESLGLRTKGGGSSSSNG